MSNQKLPVHCEKHQSAPCCEVLFDRCAQATITLCIHFLPSWITLDGTCLLFFPAVSPDNLNKRSVSLIHSDMIFTATNNKTNIIFYLSYIFTYTYVEVKDLHLCTCIHLTSPSSPCVCLLRPFCFLCSVTISWTKNTSLPGSRRRDTMWSRADLHDFTVLVRCLSANFLWGSWYGNLRVLFQRKSTRIIVVNNPLVRLFGGWHLGGTFRFL